MKTILYFRWSNQMTLSKIEVHTCTLHRACGIGTQQQQIHVRESAHAHIDSPAASAIENCRQRWGLGMSTYIYIRRGRTWSCVCSEEFNLLSRQFWCFVQGIVAAHAKGWQLIQTTFFVTCELSMFTRIMLAMAFLVNTYSCCRYRAQSLNCLRIRIRTSFHLAAYWYCLATVAWQNV